MTWIQLISKVKSKDILHLSEGIAMSLNANVNGGCVVSFEMNMAWLPKSMEDDLVSLRAEGDKNIFQKRHDFQITFISTYLK